VPSHTLHETTGATMLARLGYASPVWWGFICEADLDCLIRHAKHNGFLPEDALTFESSELMQLFVQAIMSNHHYVLRHLCTKHPARQYSLCPWRYPVALPTRDRKNQ